MPHYMTREIRRSTKMSSHKRPLYTILAPVLNYVQLEIIVSPETSWVKEAVFANKSFDTLSIKEHLKSAWHSLNIFFWSCPICSSSDTKYHALRAFTPSSNNSVYPTLCRTSSSTCQKTKLILLLWASTFLQRFATFSFLTIRFRIACLIHGRSMICWAEGRWSGSLDNIDNTILTRSTSSSAPSSPFMVFFSSRLACCTH